MIKTTYNKTAIYINNTYINTMYSTNTLNYNKKTIKLYNTINTTLKTISTYNQD